MSMRLTKAMSDTIDTKRQNAYIREVTVRPKGGP